MSSKSKHKLKKQTKSQLKYANRVSINKELLKSVINDPYNYANKISIIKLEKLLRSLSYMYYNTGSSLVPDEIYDMLLNILKTRDKNNRYLSEVGAPISKDKVTLPYEMHSLDKIKSNTDALKIWLKKYPGKYVVSDKLDGVSGLLVWTSNGINLYTRGNGTKGQDISFLISYVVPQKVDLNKIPIGTAIRGELVISKKNFKTIKHEMKNARNAVAGLVNSKNYSMKIAEITDFIAYSIVNPRYTHIKQMKLLNKYKMDVVNYKVKTKLTTDYLSKLLIDRRKTGLYDIDGIVVVDSSKSYKLQSNNPIYGFAFKTVLTDQVAEVIVVDIEWRASVNGYLKPRVKITPVTIGGVKITYATGFNARFIVKHKLGPGSVIKISRSGDVIPHILKVLKPSASNKPKLPDVGYRWNKTKVDFIVKDIHGVYSDQILIKRISSFFKTLGVKYISSGVVTKLVKNGYNTIQDIIDIDIDEASKIDGIGNKLMTKIVNNLHNALKTTDLKTFMSAPRLLGRGLGKRKIKIILDTYPNILNKKWNVKKMISKLELLDGFSTITATIFSKNLPKLKEFIKNVSKVFDISHLTKLTPTNKIIKTKKQLFYNEKIVFTGVRDKELEQLIENEGGKVVSSVSSKTTLVVYKPTKKLSSKVKKALKLGIKTVKYNIFSKKYK